MGIVHVLSTETINQIAAGEVIERPASVVKELVENAVDSGATRVTVEIEDGGVSLIRVTDNGSGFAKDDIRTAFLRHATSKISCGEDLFRIHSLGFRGEALSSIAAVAKVELLTLNENDYLGSRFVIEGGEEVCFEEAGCPQGTTMLVKDLFYNVPARRKFLKSKTTEAGYCNEWINRFAVSHPDVSVTFLSQGRTVLQTPGNGKLKDTIFAVYGRGIAENLLPVSYEGVGLTISGVVGATVITKSNRNFELCFVNGRDVRSKVLFFAIEEAFRTYVMQHKYPFTALFLDIRPDILDVNIHPTKSDVRFTDSDEVSHAVYSAVRNALQNANLIRMSVLPGTEQPPEGPAAPVKERPAEMFEASRIAQSAPVKTPVSAVFAPPKPANWQADPEIPKNSLESPFSSTLTFEEALRHTSAANGTASEASNESASETENKPVSESVIAPVSEPADKPVSEATAYPETTSYQDVPEAVAETSVAEDAEAVKYEQLAFVDPKQDRSYRIVGQVFNTYWIIEMPHQIFMIDQHAAHEKINYERLIAKVTQGGEYTQQISPPEVLTLTMREEEALLNNREYFAKLGFEITDLGGREYAINGVPMVLLGIAPRDYICDTLNLLSEDRKTDDPLLRVAEKVASMSCKAAIKGGQEISRQEAEHLIAELMTLENPFHCPHGRPIIVAMTKTDIEKRFKRIV